MNILFLINHAGKGGSEKYVYVLSSYLNNKNNKIFFIYNEDGNLVEKMKSLGAVTDQVEMKNPFDKKAVSYIKDFCELKQIDIIHTQFQRETYIALQVKKQLPNLKVINTSHMITEDKFYKKILNKVMVKNIDGVISVCTKNKEVLIENGYPEDKIKVIFNGVPYRPYAHNIKNSTLRSEFKIGTDEFVFVTAARLSPEKGIDFLLESAKVLTTLTNKKFKLLIVGDGDEEEKLKEIVNNDDALKECVIFTGFRTDIENILMGSDCFVNSSETEALSFAILEALAKALPVIATKVGGTSDIINEENRNGVLVRYGGKVAMAKAMERFMTDEKIYLECSQNAIDSVKNHFSIDKICEETYNFYKEVKGENVL